MTARLAGVVVTWNSARHLADCVGAVRASADRASVDVPIVVVDNASSDGSAALARALDCERVIENAVNVGFAAAAAQGLEVADAEWLLSLNADALVEASFVSKLLDVCDDAAEDVGAVVPELRFASSRDLINSRGIGVDRLGIPLERDAGRVHSLLVGARDEMPLFGGSGGACAYRAKALDAVGSFEPAYFAYLEDVDLAWRLQGAGFGAILAPHAVVYHEVSASTGEASPVKAYLVGRNRRLLFGMHGPHDLRTRLLRDAVDAAHCAVQVALTRDFAPVRGRLDAWSLRGYARFLRRSRSAPAFDPPLGLRRDPFMMAVARKRRARLTAGRPPLLP